MSIHLVEVDVFGAKTGHRTMAVRVIAKAVFLATRIGLAIADEIVYVIRQDLRDGLISRDPKDWEL